MPQIIPIKDLKNTSEISEMCHKAEEPVYITKNGYGDMVIMSMENYENTIQRLNVYRELEISEQQISEGRTKDARSSLSSMRANMAYRINIKHRLVYQVYGDKLEIDDTEYEGIIKIVRMWTYYEGMR